jgi:enolase-phosphatase E1
VTVGLVQEPIGTILLDIEGTTTPVDFVHRVLFPYARSRLRQFLEQQLSSQGVRSDLSALRQEHGVDAREGLRPPALGPEGEPGGLESMVAYIAWLMARDRKSTPLKSLQGKIWEQGYRSGQLSSPVFTDVPPAFERWHKQQRRITIFSSGSVQAQRLLFAHTVVGDLTPYLSRYFDTTTGPKSDPRSYQAIAGALGEPPSEILFISDVTAELDAATAAGCQALLCERAGNHPQPPGMHSRIGGFEEVLP